MLGHGLLPAGDPIDHSEIIVPIVPPLWKGPMVRYHCAPTYMPGGHHSVSSHWFPHLRSPHQDHIQVHLDPAQIHYVDHCQVPLIIVYHVQFHLVRRIVGIQIWQ